MADADTIDSTGTVSPGSPAVRGATADRSQSQPIDSNRLLGALGISGLNSTLAADRADVQSKEPGPPKLTPMPPPAPPTDPFQAFGQPAMWLAALGSLLTRQPLTAAIQSAGAVLKSTHDQDLAAAQQHFNEWKINSENAMKMAKYEQDAYKAAITKYGTDARAGEAQIRTVAAAFKNEALLKVYQTEGMTGVVRYLKKGSADTSMLSERALKLQDAMQDHLDKLAARQAWNDGHPNATPSEKSEAYLAIDKGQDPDAGKGASANWQPFTDAKTNTQGYFRIRADDKPEYQDMAGNPMQPPEGLQHIGTEHDPTAGSSDYIQMRVENDLKTLHPDWEPGKLSTEAKRVASEASQPTISDDAAKIAADVALKTGHPPAWMGRSSGALTKFLDTYAAEAKRQGMSADDIAANIVKFSGETAEARTLGTASGRIDLSARELDVALPQALELSDRVYRPGFKSIAAIQQALQGQTSDPDLLEFAQLNQQVMSAYAMAMNRGGMSTVSSMERAENLLSTATSQTGYMRQLDRLHKEVQTILYGTAAAKQSLVNEITGESRQVPSPTLTGVQRAKPEGMTDDDILNFAKKRIATKPDQKDAVIKQLKAWGINTDGL
jgi:hypothetical protein